MKNTVHQQTHSGMNSARVCVMGQITDQKYFLLKTGVIGVTSILVHQLCKDLERTWSLFRMILIYYACLSSKGVGRGCSKSWSGHCLS